MIEIENMRNGYVDIVNHVLHRGHETSPRGMRTKEVLDEVIVLHDPSDSLPLGVGRGIHVPIAAVEAIQLTGGFVDPALMLRVSDQFRSFVEEDGRFWGGYGERIGAQLLLAVQKLTQDRDTRQAIITLWNPTLDNVPGKKDYPCTIALHLMIRDDKLQLHVTMRSNDVWLGLAYDVFQFTQLQLTVARALDLEPGPYFHHDVSLHFYERDWHKTEQLHPARDDRPWTTPTGFGRSTVDDIFRSQKRAQKIGRGESVLDITESEQWYVDKLAPYITDGETQR